MCSVHRSEKNAIGLFFRLIEINIFIKKNQYGEEKYRESKFTVSKSVILQAKNKKKKKKIHAELCVQVNFHQNRIFLFGLILQVSKDYSEFEVSQSNG